MQKHEKDACAKLKGILMSLKLKETDAQLKAGYLTHGFYNRKI